MSTETPSPETIGDTTDKRTADRPTCRNDSPHCPHENPAVDDRLECFDCFRDLHRLDERPADVSPFVGF